MQELIDLLQSFRKDYDVLSLGLGCARVLALVSVAPFLGSRWAPATARVVVAFALTVACYPVISAGPAPPAGSLLLGLLLLKETLIGLAFGYAASLVFLGAEAAGDAIEAARGSSMSQVLNPATREPSSPLGTMYGLLAVSILFVSKGYLIMVEALAGSFRLVPVSTVPSVSADRLLYQLSAMSASMFVLAAALAGPVLLAVVVTDLVVGLVSRAAPQLNAYFMALPIKASVALAVAAIGLTAAVALLGEEASRMIPRAFDLLSPW